MAYAINGAPGAGEYDAYQLGLQESLRVACVSFVYSTDGSAGFRAPQVVFQNPDRSVIAQMPDWNDVGPGSVVSYTFGVGLNPFSCEVGNGGAVQHDLPLTVLEQSCYVRLRSIHTNGTVVPGDTFQAVVLWVEDSADVGEDESGVIPPYTSLENPAALTSAGA